MRCVWLSAIIVDLPLVRGQSPTTSGWRARLWIAEAEADRASLLAPILEQVRRIRGGRRGRRGVVDVDPNTGEDLPPDPNEPTDDEA